VVAEFTREQRLDEGADENVNADQDRQAGAHGCPSSFRSDAGAGKRRC
jgi:hypothetical protein